jgi:2-polyprenyl-3-methyl-5-hydroxy-6-metoxy-1,4-benzoquinol methylase
VRYTTRPARRDGHDFRKEAKIEGKPKPGRVCRVCGQRSPATEFGLVSNGFPLNQCHACASVLVESKPSDDELAELYDELFAEGDYEAHRNEFEALAAGRVPFRFYRRKLLRRSQRHTTGKRLVEIGGGTGAFAGMAKEAGYDYTDYDISQEAVRCQRELGNAAFWFHPSELPPIQPRTADIVVMWEVIEHVWDLDGYLRMIRAALKPGGVYLFSTPNFARPEYQQSLRRSPPLSSPPVHLNFFTAESLRNVLRVHGWSSVQFLTDRIRRPTGGRTHLIRTALGMYPPETIYGLGR